MKLPSKLLLLLTLFVSACAPMQPCPVCALPPQCPAPPQLPALSPIPPGLLGQHSVRQLDQWLASPSGLSCSKGS
jgi:hypothetical protein